MLPFSKARVVDRPPDEKGAGASLCRWAVVFFPLWKRVALPVKRRPPCGGAVLPNGGARIGRLGGALCGWVAARGRAGRGPVRRSGAGDTEEGEKGRLWRPQDRSRGSEAAARRRGPPRRHPGRLRPRQIRPSQQPIRHENKPQKDLQRLTKAVIIGYYVSVGGFQQGVSAPCQINLAPGRGGTKNA